MSKAVTYLVNLNRSKTANNDVSVSLINLGSGDAQSFNSLDSAINFLDKSYANPNSEFSTALFNNPSTSANEVTQSGSRS